MKKLLTILLLVTFLAGNTYAQFISYGFMPTNGTYTEITGGTVLGNESSDDEVFVDPAAPLGGSTSTGVGLPIGFDFVFNGITFDRFAVDANGWMSLGQSALTPSVNITRTSSPLSSTTTITPASLRNCISAFARDLEAVAGSSIRYATVGTAPNRTLILQFKNYVRYGSTGTGDNLNFQIRLNESTNEVQLVYGSMTTTSTNSSTVQVGLGGNVATEYLNRTSLTGWDLTTGGTSNSATVTYASTIFPVSGLTYTFAPMIPLAASYNSPANGSNGMPLNVSLNWAYNGGNGGGAPSGYRVYMGTDTPPTNIANGTNVGTALSYTAPANLNTNTVYNWQIVPFNSVGDAINNATYSFTTTAGFGDLEGFVTNGFGIPISGANVTITNGVVTYSTTSAANGAYSFQLVYASNYTLTAVFSNYNNTVLNVAVSPNVTAYQNVVMTRPSMAVTPNPYSVSVNPNEMVNGAFSITNNGDGILDWNATINYTSPEPGSWLTLGQSNGTVSAYNNFNLPVAFNANGLAAGTVATAEITFTSTPNVGTVVIPVTMTVSGTTLSCPTDLVATLTNPVDGIVTLSWDFQASRAFQNFIIKRDGVQVGTATGNNFVNTLPAFGVYSYTVQAVYDEGNSAPAGPVVVEWSNPEMVLEPSALNNGQYPNTSEPVTFRITNNGLGTLAYSFPEFAARQLVSSPDFTPNAPNTLKEVNVAKGEADPTDGQGTRNLRGAGGPDEFGYVWIDSDEEGGPSYVWNDISSTGTVITGFSDDNVLGPFPLGFSFPFYENTYSDVNVSSNGYLIFGSTASAYSNQNIPNSSSPNNLIAWAWDDMTGSGSGPVYYQNMGDHWVIQFTNYKALSGGGTITAQVHLYPNGHIRLYYNNLSGFTGTSATVGIENNTGTIATSLSYNTAYLHNGMAVNIDFPIPSFITAVNPVQGQVAPGEFVDVTATFTSDDLNFPVGTYTGELELTTNDLANQDVIIPATMVVYEPGMISGTVTDAANGSPIFGANVTVGSNNALTDAEGNYHMIIDAGTYTVSISKTGYNTEVVSGVVVNVNATTVVDAALEEELYPATLVNAVVNEPDTQADVTWGTPHPDYEILYDDGTAENYTAWALPGNMNAVKFTPAGYPATVYGGKIFVGDGSFPNNNTGFIGTTFGAMVMDDSGANGMPGAVLDSIEVTVDNYGWVNFSGLNATIESGNFYLVMIQGATSPNAAGVGVDQTTPTSYRSYSRNVVAGGAWGLSPYQDLMIHALVSGPASTDELVADAQVVRNPLKQRGMISQSPATAQSGAEGEGQYLAIQSDQQNREVTNYSIWRIAVADPNLGPENGVQTLVNNSVSTTNYTDVTFGPLPEGWYAYAVAANYTLGGQSEKAYSNIVAHKKLVDVTANVSLTTGGSPAGAVVALTGQDYPYSVLTQTVPESGTVTFTDVFKGNYVLEASKVGFDDYVMNSNIQSNRTFNIVLAERKYMPRNLYVDGLTSIATWNEPLAISVLEDFEGATFPPAGWQALTQNTTGWYATTNGSSSNFTIPAHTKYAVTNDDADNGDGCCDYLITPVMDWTDLPSYRLNFASYYTGEYSQAAYIEISTDNGASWTVINTLAPATAWTDIEVDLAAYSGATGLGSVMLAFHGDDNGEWSSGWAIDDVKIASGGVPFQGYGVFLDGSLVANTPDMTYTYTDLNYGQKYMAGVAALFSSGYSELDTYEFTSTYLIPPTELAGVSPESTDYVHLTWLAPTVPAEYTVSEPELRTSMPLASVEYSPYITNLTFKNQQNTRDLWDVLLSFDAQAASMPGIETDGEFIYISNWQGTNFGKYNLDGTWVEDFTISGAANIRDMAYDGVQYMYGGQASTTIYKMDFHALTLAGTISTSGVSVRHIAYDPTADNGNGGLWAGNWSDLALVSLSGATLQTVSGISLSGIYGSAYDANSDGGPYLWLFDQGGNGGDIYQFSIANLAMTGVMQDASTVPGFASGSTAGGMAASGLVVPGKFVLLGNVQQDPNFIFGYELGDYNGGGQSVANLVGYNIYRDDAKVAYVEKPALEYFDLALAPATYTYHITAVYDLTPYGFAGQTGESMIEGPIDVDVTYGYELPFVENFNTGVFETNQWTTNGGNNWQIAGQAGNPAPAAEFTFAPVVTDYNQTLTSSYLIGSGIVDGSIKFDFDLKHTLVNPSETEVLAVEVYNGSSWVQKAEFKNTENLDWETQSLDITSQAKGHVFQVRFVAKGETTTNIVNWLVDNIHIYRVCAAPTELTAEVNAPHGDQILLTWEAPEGPGQGVSGWLFWDNGINADAIGLTGGGTFNVAVRFTPDQLAQYAGTSLTKIRMFPYATGGTIVLKVWTGANASQLVLSQPIASYNAGAWNEFTLTTPVPVTGTTELWFGYAVTHGADYVAGCDAGPAVAGYGDMLSMDGSVWESMSTSYGLNYNWNLQGYVESVDGATASLQTLTDNTVYGPVSTIARGNLPMLSGAALGMDMLKGSRELTGYNVYRGGELIGNSTETTYVDADPTLEIGTLYCYNVTAVYEDCESEYSNEACETPTSVENLETSSVNIYPNPSNNVVNMELTGNIDQFVVYNYVGQVVYEQVVTKNQTVQLNVSNYDAGAYLVKFITNSGESFTRKIAVTK